MSDQQQNPDESEEFVPQWGSAAPKGGRAVLNRILREGNKVPLFLGQTFVQSLRDVGYNNTTSAICEHVDNSIQAGATEIRVYFNQAGPKGAHEVDVAILDNGPGMPPHVLQVAMSFGGSMYYENRSGIGRFGVGMKTAALAMGPVLEVYSWQERNTIYSMTLDVEEISSSRTNLIELPEPRLMDALPSQAATIFTKPMAYPKEEAQDLLAFNEDDLSERISKSGTLIFIPNCDRLSYKTARTLAEHATREMSRIYRRQLGDGLRLFINNRRIEAFDPTFWMQTARHVQIEGLQDTRSKLINSWPEIHIPVEENSKQVGTASVRLYMLPIESWYDLPRKTLANDLQLFSDQLVSFMRNGREVHIGVVPELSGRRHADAVWLRLQVDFAGDLDEAFGVAMNKQGVRPKKYALDIIREHIKDDVTRVREKTKEFRAAHTRTGQKSHLTEAEQVAQEADALQAKPLPSYAATTEEEQRALDQNLRTLALTLKRHDESDDDAFERIKKSRYLTMFKHDPYWPFYHVDFQLGKVILTVNTAHPFFTQLYEPLSRVAVQEDESDGDGGTPRGASAEGSDLLTGLQMLLLSLARTQSQMLSSEGSAEYRQLFENLRKEWSDSLKTQLQMTRR